MELFSAADKAMYAAKKNGKRQVFFYEDVLYPYGDTVTMQNPDTKIINIFRFKLLTTRSVYSILIVNRPGGHNLIRNVHEAGRENQQTKRRIMESALKEFAEQGYGASSVNNICSCEGVSKESFTTISDQG